MKEIDQAYRVLDLTPGATLRQVVEARDELRTLWDPGRLARHPRLHAKAPGKIQKVERAYEILAAELGRTDSARPSPARAEQTRLPAPALPHETASEKPSASLFDEVFPKKGESPARRSVPMWVLVTSVTAVGLLVAYFIPSSPPAENRPELSSLYNAQGPLSAPPAAGTLHQKPDRPGPEKTAGPVTASPTDASAPNPQSLAAAQTNQPPQSVSASQPPPSPTPAKHPHPPPERDRTEVDSDKRRDPRPVLIRSPTPPAAREESVAEPQKKVPEPSAEDREAYQNLLQYSPTARRLAEGGFQTLQFVEWKIVQNTPAEARVDLVGRASAGEPIHFIWSISRKDHTARPLSQAARNLERQSQAN